MNDLPKTITIDLSKEPALAAMLQALLVAHGEQHKAHEKAYEEYQAYVAALPTEKQEMIADGSMVIGGPYPVPPLPPRLDLAGLALEALREGVASRLQRGDVLGAHVGPYAVAATLPRLIHRGYR